MALAIGSIQAIYNTDEADIVIGTITASGSYTTGGDTLSFAGFDQIKSGSVPAWVDIEEFPTSGVQSGYAYGFIPGTTLANGKMTVFTSAAAASPFAQLGAGAYPAGITGATLKFKAFFNRI